MKFKVFFTIVIVFIVTLLSRTTVFPYKRCRSDCVEDFQYLMDITGWSKNTLMFVFFAGIFVLLVSATLIFAKFFSKKNRSRGKPRLKKY